MIILKARFASIAVDLESQWLKVEVVAHEIISFTLMQRPVTKHVSQNLLDFFYTSNCTSSHCNFLHRSTLLAQDGFVASRATSLHRYRIAKLYADFMI